MATVPTPACSRTRPELDQFHAQHYDQLIWGTYFFTRASDVIPGTNTPSSIPRCLGCGRTIGEHPDSRPPKQSSVDEFTSRVLDADIAARADGRSPKQSSVDEYTRSFVFVFPVMECPSPGKGIVPQIAPNTITENDLQVCYSKWSNTECANRTSVVRSTCSSSSLSYQGELLKPDITMFAPGCETIFGIVAVIELKAPSASAVPQVPDIGSSEVRQLARRAGEAEGTNLHLWHSNKPLVPRVA